MRKPIKIDWDELEDAFANPDENFDRYLDRVTGHVVLEGEGEDNHPNDDDASYGRAPAPVSPPQDDATRLYVHPPTAERKIEWMNGFVAANDKDKDHAPVIAELKQALEGADAPTALSEVLNRNPDVRDSWYLYRTERLRELIESWLSSNDVEATEPPPWR